MTAPAGFQKGSFRGVAFVTEQQQRSGGRRGVTHEFPQAEKPVWEDLGRQASRFSLDVHVRGENYPAGANDLEDALDAPDVGTLIHPWRGSMQVSVASFTRTDSTVEGGIATFSIEFVESGLPAVPAPAVDSSALATAAADGAIDEAQAQFGDRFSLAGTVAFVEAATTDLVAALAIVASIEVAVRGGVGGVLRGLVGALDRLGIGGIVRDAAALGLGVVQLVQIVSVASAGFAGRVAAMRTLMAFGSDMKPVIGDTPQRDRQRANQAAFVQLVNLAASAELVRTVAQLPFASYQDAVRLRDEVADALDALALRQADAGDDDGAASYDALRRALVRDVTARGGSLARLQAYTPATSEPALVIAQRLYGNPARVADRAQEIVDRNRIAHPLFVPGGTAIEVVTPGGATYG